MFPWQTSFDRPAFQISLSWVFFFFFHGLRPFYVVFIRFDYCRVNFEVFEKSRKP